MTTTKEEIVNGDEVFYVERHSVAEGTFGFSDLKSMVLLAAKLRNKAVFFTRQHFFNKTGRDFQYDMFEHIESKYVSYNTLYRYLYDTTDFNFFSLPSTVAQDILRNVNNEWSSYKELLAKKKRGEYDGKINIPGYSDTKNEATYSITFYKSNLSKNSLEKGIVNIPTTDISIKTTIPAEKIRTVKVSYQTGQCFVDVVYDAPNGTPAKQDNGNYLAIDLGLNNLLTIISNLSNFRPIIIDGRELKSINWYYNKTISEYTKKKAEENPYFDSDEYTRRLWKDRYNILHDYIHLIAQRVVEIAVVNRINTIVIGHNKRWKDELPFRKNVKQNFAYLPYSLLIDYIKMKASFFGITTVEQEESYTSKASFIDDDFIPVYKEGDKTEYEFSGQRIKRGLYKTKNGILINADVNGAYNILRKYLNVSSKEIITRESIGLVMAPVRIKIKELKHRSRITVKFFNK